MNKPGLYGDIVLDGNDLYVGRMTTDHKVIVEKNEQLLWEKDVSQFNQIMFLSMILHNGELICAGKNAINDNSVIVRHNSFVTTPANFGNYSCIIGKVNGEPRLFGMINATQYAIYDLNGTQLSVHPTNIPPTSQGIRFINDSGQPVFGDQTFAKVFNGLTLIEWMQRSGITAGQCEQTGVKPGIGVASDIIKFTHFDRINCRFPKLAVQGDKIAILMAHNNQINYDTFVPPYPTIEVPDPIDPIPVNTNRIKAHRRKTWISPYYVFGEHHGYDEDQSYYNAITLVHHENDPNMLYRDLQKVSVERPFTPLLVHGSKPVPAQYIDKIIGWWIGTYHLTDLISGVQFAQTLPEKPVYAYLDRPEEWFGTNNPDWDHKRVIPLVQVYRGGIPLNLTETVNELEIRVRRYFDHVLKFAEYIGMEPAFYTRNGVFAPAQIVECFGLYSKLMHEYPICMITPFVSQRPTGMKQHPELKDGCRMFFEANPERPNRFDYWIPIGVSIEDQIHNKLSQDVEMIHLFKEQKQFILNCINENGEDPDLDELLDDDNIEIVKSVANEFPHLHGGPATDQVIHRLNRHHNVDVYGRKARNSDPNNPNCNEDTVTIRLDDNDLSKKKLIDIWIDGDAPGLRPTWDVRPAHEEPNNGFWHPALT